MGKVKYTEEQKRKLLQEVKEGRSIVEAAEKYGWYYVKNLDHFM
jgi:hypothetical protein